MAKEDHFSRLRRDLHARCEALRIRRPISRPLSAYQLGYGSRFSWMWGEGLWLDPGEDLARENVQGALCLARHALVDLADRLDPQLLHGLHQSLDELTGMARVWEWLGTVVPIAPPYRMTEATWRSLLEPAGRGLDKAGGLGPWFGLGQAVGQYENELQLLPSPGAIEPVDLDGWPDIRPVVRAAQALPVTDLRRLPLLDSLVRLAASRPESGQADLLIAYIGENEASWTYRPGDVDFMTMSFVIQTLDQQIQSQLGLFAGDPGSQPDEDTPNPVWDREFRELRYRGEVVRPPFRFDAANAMAILDDFQNHEPSWPRRVDSPIKAHRDDQSDRLKDAIKTLNANLTILRFRSDGDGDDEGITWGLVGSISNG